MPWENEQNRRSLFPFGNKPSSTSGAGVAVGGVVGKPMPDGITSMKPLRPSPTIYDRPGGAEQNLKSLAAAHGSSVAPVPPSHGVAPVSRPGPGILPASGPLRASPTREQPGNPNLSISLKMPRTKPGR